MILAYDIETLPNMLSYVFQDVGDPERVFEFVVFGDRDDRPKMLEFLQENRPELVGFNSYWFDDLILAATGIAPQKPPAIFYELAQKLIGNRRDEIRFWSQIAKARDEIASIDLLQLLGSRNVSLKEIAGKLGLPLVEMPVPHDRPIKPDELDIVLEYNRSDVRVTVALYKELAGVIETRRGIGREFGVNALSCSDSVLANRILEKLHGRPKNQGTPRTRIDLEDIISGKLRFDSPEFVSLVNDLRGMSLSSENGFSFSKRIRFGRNSYKLGTGGIHSEDSPGIFRNDSARLLDADVTSYYPMIMLQNDIFPEHLDRGFLSFFREMVETRIQAKRAGDKVRADGLKITINATFGKLNSQFFWLYDPRAFIAVTINGQLFLLDLIEKLELAGIHVLSANTDGVLSQVPPELESVYSAVVKGWQSRTGFELEFQDLELYVRRDVNNYIARSIDGRIKTKGVFSEERNLRESYRAPIVARSLVDYFTRGIDPGETIDSETGVLPFCYVFKPEKNFEMIFRTPLGDTPAGRVNRYYMARNGGLLVKRGSNAREIMVRKSPVWTVNEYLPETVGDIDREFYLREIWGVIEKIDSRGAGFGEFGPLFEPREEPPVLETDIGDKTYPTIPSSYSPAEIAQYMSAIDEDDSWRAPCPLHDGKSSRSLLIRDIGGELSLHCFGGCDPNQVLAEIESRIDGGEEFRKPEFDPLGELVAEYPYTDEFGRVLYKKQRFDPKNFRVSSPGLNGEFSPGINGSRRVLYRLPEILAAETILILEGEKDAETARALGFVGTCNHAGAGEWDVSYSRTLAGKDVVIIPDNDSPGREHSETVRTSVFPFAKSVRVLALPNVPEHGDLTDWVSAGGTAAELRELIRKAEPIKPGELVSETELVSAEYGPHDEGNALAVRRLYGDRIRFTGGFGWMYFDGRYWTTGEIAESYVNRLILEVLARRRSAAVRAQYEELQKSGKGGEDKKSRFELIVEKCSPSTSRVNSVRNMLKNYVTTGETEFQNTPGLLNVRNGVIDLKTGVLFSSHPAYGFTYVLDIDYESGAYSEIWERFIDETVPDETRHYLQMAIGSTFSGDPREESVYWIVGPPRSGKGTLTETLQYLGESIAAEVSIKTFLDRKNANEQNFDLAGLHHARFVHASESGGNDWVDSAFIKAISGGNSVRTAFKGKDLFSYRPMYSVWITSNEPPRMKPEDKAAWYRLKVLEFPYSKAGSEDKNLKLELRKPENLRAVLSWIVEGSVYWYANPQGLQTPETVSELTESYREALDYLGQFLEEYFEITGSPDDLAILESQKFTVSADRLYELYKGWHDDNGAPELSKNSLTNRIRQRVGGVNLNPNKCRVYVKDLLTGKSKQIRVIAGIRERSESDSIVSEAFAGIVQEIA